MLEIRDLTVGYDDRPAVVGLDLTVDDHEVVSVLGPSGSGKTTLLRAIAGLERPTAGSILRDGIDLAEVPPHRRGLGFMFQDHALFPHRDVLGNVMFGLRMHGASRADAGERAREVLALVGLAGSEARRVHELSGGEQQRVALARALAPEPSLLMLDEPLGALDRALRESLADDLRELFVRLELSVLLVTHDHDEAFAIGDRVAVMHAGRIEQIGRPEAVWARPATEFVAHFLGWNVTDALGAHGAVRPDALRIDPDGPLAGTVAARTFRRDHFRLRVILGGGEQLLVEVRTDDVPAVGEHVSLSADPDGVVLLPVDP
jgi:thiamine transport system ATP-binding protein